MDSWHYVPLSLIRDYRELELNGNHMFAVGSWVLPRSVVSLWLVNYQLNWDPYI